MEEGDSSRSGGHEKGEARAAAWRKFHLRGRSFMCCRGKGSQSIEDVDRGGGFKRTIWNVRKGDRKGGVR